jgi:ADP-dependent NAD(P)H-hydrate dehydratase / NAD(P)H-hydrate epimerase
MYVVDSDQMRNIDRRATEQFGIPSLLLMENAAAAVAEAIADTYPGATTFIIFCGPGQNGGDGFALARHLRNRGGQCLLFLVSRAHEGDLLDPLSGDARLNAEICLRLEIPVIPLQDASMLDDVIESASAADLIVDALFGTGLTRPLEGHIGELVTLLEQISVPIVAVDLPSGLQASSGVVQGPTVAADLTVTFAVPKLAHLLEPAASLCGVIAVADISIPPEAIEAEQVRRTVITPARAAICFPERVADSHKGTYGHVAIVAGSAGRSGAAILSARGALRAGAGLVSVLTDHETAGIVDSVSIESMTRAIDWSAGAAEILRELEGRDAMLIGSGLQDDEQSYRRIRELLETVILPSVLDAGAISAFAGNAELIAALPSPQRVLTPHPGELARLLSVDVKTIQDDRIAAASAAATRTGSIVLLKGSRSIIASPEGEIAINPTGNPGMASGGMGDVLGGIMAALLARGCDPFEASCAAAFVHGRAGDLLADDAGETGLAALDLAERLPWAITSLSEKA